MNLNPNSKLVPQVLASYKSEWTFSLPGEISQDTIKVSVQRENSILPSWTYHQIWKTTPDSKTRNLAYLNYQNQTNYPLDHFKTNFYSGFAYGWSCNPQGQPDRGERQGGPPPLLRHYQCRNHNLIAGRPSALHPRPAMAMACVVKLWTPLVSQSSRKWVGLGWVRNQALKILTC